MRDFKFQYDSGETRARPKSLSPSQLWAACKYSRTWTAKSDSFAVEHSARLGTIWSEHVFDILIRYLRSAGGGKSIMMGFDTCLRHRTTQALAAGSACIDRQVQLAACMKLH